MNKLLFMSVLCGLSLSTVQAQQTAKKAVGNDWKEGVSSTKMNFLSKLKKTGKVVESPVIRSGQDATDFSADVKGWDNLVLVTYGTEDGSSGDYGTWADAKLIDATGKSISLKDLRESFGKDGFGEIYYDRNTRWWGDLTVKINKKPYKETILANGNSMIIIPLNKKYVRFESKVGIDDDSNKGTVIFRAQNLSGQDEVKQFINKFDKESLAYRSFAHNNFKALFQTEDVAIERSMAWDAANRVAKPEFLHKQIEKIDAETNLKKKIEGYLEVFEDATRIADLQNQLEWLNVGSIEIAMKDMATKQGQNQKENEERLKELKRIVAKGFSGLNENNKEAVKEAEKALSLKREILLSNPLLDMDKLIVGRYQMGTSARHSNPPSMGTPPNNWSNQTSASQSGFNASIEEFSNLRGDMKQRTIYKPHGTAPVPDIKLHWDADRMLFSMPEEGDHHWQVYEVGVDGSNFRQITKGTPEDLDYFDATYLPNGKIMAASNIGGQGVPCVSGDDQVGNFCLYDPKDDSMRRLTYDQDANWGPVVMNNGRVMYVRWEYTDLTHYFSRIVMHMNPDGTEQRSLYGSGSVFPTSIYDVQPLPDHPTQFIGIISGHHGTQRSGRLILFDPAKSRKEEKGMVQELPFSTRPIVPIVKDEMVDGVWPQFLKPQPLNKDYYIVTGKLAPNSLWGLYLVDVFDNLTLIAEYEGEGLIYGIPVIKRPTPPVIPEKVNMNSKEATVFIQDIYEGEGLPDVPRGTVKELRVFAYEYAYLKTSSDHVAQGIQSGWDIKRLLGTVPVEEDGSVMFTIPANTPISLQPLDSEGRAIQWMRSWLTGQPGETVSCVGCHEDQNSIPVPKRVMASTKAPQQLKIAEGGVRSFTFDLEMQPILDRNCVACHDGSNGMKDLRGGVKDKRGFGTSYLAIHPYVHRQGPEAGMKVLYPYEYHASVSPLVRMLKDGHYDVELTDSEWRTLYNWIDFNAPDKGTFKAKELPENSTFCQFDRRIDLNKKYSNGIYADWQQELKDYATYLDGKEKPAPVKPNYKEKKFKDVSVKNYPFNGNEYANKKGNQDRKVVEIAPGVNVTFVRIPAGQFVMGKNEQNRNYAPAHKAEVKKAFWMSEKEINNEQFNTFFPEHSSRYVDQQWKDHVTEGYEAFHPEQPVIRVSMNDAAAFCDEMAKKTGLNVMLPTETQWEWACRAGSDEDFWYGNMNTDFGKFENMSDSQMNNMAVSGVNPQPMGKDNPWYAYYSFHPKVETVDDGNMIMATPGSYQANPFGLYDMHGNVAEWTRSDFVTYPTTGKNTGSSDKKVVRGGSWKDHPKEATSIVRKGYYPHQKVHNVGFRIIIEE